LQGEDLTASPSRVSIKKKGGFFPIQKGLSVGTSCACSKEKSSKRKTLKKPSPKGRQPGLLLGTAAVEDDCLRREEAKGTVINRNSRGWS